MNILLYAVPAAAAVALLFAFIKARGIARRDEGEPGMAEIAHAISEGADAFLKSEYKLLLIFIAIVFAGIWLGLGSITTAVAFLVGALFSVLAGYFGMKVATRANVRAANAARTGGINEALRVAFSGGTVMGMCVVGLGLIGASILYIITENGDVLTGFCGLIVGLAIGFFTEVYTSDKYRFVKSIAEQSTTGSATNIICGLSTGMLSTCVSIILVCLGILGAYKFAGLYGIALAAVGMLSTAGMTVAVDAYGPIADNAGGIAEMAGLEDSVRDITDRLDSVGNTTAAMGKGFAIGSAALTAMALFVSYAQAAELQMIDILDPFVIIGLLLGGMLPFLFSAFTMQAVGRAAQKIVVEVRRQFKQIKGLMEGKAEADYETCVDICTRSSLKEMVLPAALGIIAPIAVGLILGVNGVVGMLAGALVSGFVVAIMMANSGGAWDNAKKYIEAGNFGGKGSDNHKACLLYTSDAADEL